MRFTAILSIFGCLFLASSVYSANTFLCIEELDKIAKAKQKTKVSREIQTAAHDFMKKNGLIAEGDEIDLPALGISTKWTVVNSVSYEDKTLLVMNNQSKGDTTEDGKTYDVLVLDNSTGKNVIRKFQDAFSIPETLKVAIGDYPPPKKLDDFYYVELKGASVIEALKSIYSQTPYFGFSGDLKAGGKAGFDPTPGRTWQIVNPNYNLRRGSTAEIHDVTPGQLDRDFQSYFKGSAGHVAPWGFSFIRRVYVDGRWVDVIKL